MAKDKIIPLSDFPQDVTLRDLARMAFLLGCELTINPFEIGTGKITITVKKREPYKEERPSLPRCNDDSVYCSALTSKGRPCGNKHLMRSVYCKFHKKGER